MRIPSTAAAALQRAGPIASVDNERGSSLVHENGSRPVFTQLLCIPIRYDMGTHMKTTVEISDPLLAEVKALASDRGQTLREIIEAGLRQWLASQKRDRRKFRLRHASVDGRGLRSGLSYDDWGKILDISYGDES